MYSRRTGILHNESEVQNKIKSFNNELREQYKRRNQNDVKPYSKTNSDDTEANGTCFLNILKNENVVIIGLILLLLSQENKDYLLIGALAALLFLTQ